MTTSEKPWWYGKTGKELDGLRVRVRYESGAELTGIISSPINSFVGIRATNSRLGVPVEAPFIFDHGEAVKLSADCHITSVNLFDDPDYERIDGHHDLREDDLIVTLIGNRYKVLATREGSDFVKCRTLEDPGSPFSLDVGEIRYVLRRKPQLPDKPGLWVDKDDSLWLAAQAPYEDWDFTCLRTDGHWIADGKRITRFNRNELSGFAPFRPYKPEVDND